MTNQLLFCLKPDKRGSIDIICAEKLQAATCECYELIVNEYSRLLDSFIE